MLYFLMSGYYGIAPTSPFTATVTISQDINPNRSDPCELSYGAEFRVHYE